MYRARYVSPFLIALIAGYCLQVRASFASTPPIGNCSTTRPSWTPPKDWLSLLKDWTPPKGSCPTTRPDGHPFLDWLDSHGCGATSRPACTPTLDDKDPNPGTTDGKSGCSSSGGSSTSGDNDNWTRDFGDLLKHLCDDGQSGPWTPPDCTGSSSSASTSGDSDTNTPQTSPCHWATTGGDSTSSGVVEGAMVINGGTSVCESPADELATVPEPASLALVAVTVGATLSRRRRR